VTRFGAFFDSVIDRYSDMVLFLGLVVWYAKLDRIFTRSCRYVSDWLHHDQLRELERVVVRHASGSEGERIVLRSSGLTSRMGAAMWVMAVLSNWTVFQRIWYTWQETKNWSNVNSVSGVLRIQAQG
jgi:CDP-diacylglycerol--glycerol-3-phosphate 3-phosphatidyltransferase